MVAPKHEVDQASDHGDEATKCNKQVCQRILLVLCEPLNVCLSQLVAQKPIICLALLGGVDDRVARVDALSVVGGNVSAQVRNPIVEPTGPEADLIGCHVYLVHCADQRV